ncbi:aminoglycoside phosphotransferase family protein [Microbispora hainanensis]|uniref:Aminoglycoside phosphotransferase family protein n=1 Tax=Microbispora hainanensis TaxID=568844 RepID=A0A544YA26_9ACTN|nr:aminoglycoside phosphotransferase family protein [Microbispora hainanensis]TQS13598.1 aminoglycoside phosphotransferase family protein [Microbispora hainanensis]
MALEPRFRRVAALHRRFVNREGPQAVFDEELANAGHGPRVLNITGVGGIGKSRLLRELAQRAHASCLVATLDLQVPSHRHQEDALAVLRMQLGRQGVRFDRYDIAYAVLWQRLHPHLGLTRQELPFVEASEVLTEVLDTAAGVPVFATAVGLVKLLERGAGARKRRRHLRTDETLAQLDQLPGADMVDAVTYLFAEDLRTGLKDEPYVILIDAYDALGNASSDVWLRDLVVQLDRGLVVIASREPLPWRQYDPERAGIIRQLPLEGLAMDARMELLADGGIIDPQVCEVIAQASVGVPFYLHLAVDGQGSGRVVSQDEIMQRFLQHVGADERRYLELLSIARTFDFELFTHLAQAFHLPAGRLAWERLSSYSFVYPAAESRFQLHQLMANVLCVRLSQAVARDAHRVLHGLWNERVRDGQATTALREAAYHGLRAGVLCSDHLLDYADRITALGGSQGVAGLVADVLEHLDQAGPDASMDQTARCLAGEAAVLLGDAEKINNLTPDGSWSLQSRAGSRLAVVAGHGRRISGQTAQALKIYSSVWQGRSGPERHPAGLWSADLHMAQGRFRTAAELVGQVDAECPPDAHILRGDLARLLHLAARFSYDFEPAETHLRQAESYYQQADTIIGTALIKTNWAELLAWTDPLSAIQVVGEAIEANTDLGALHEVGKAYTALGHAQLALGRLDEAATSIDQACRALEKAGYRSGRARAELVRAVLHARYGQAEQAVASARWAVAELVAVEVYPTLLILAEHLLDILGHASLAVSRAAQDARELIEAPDGLDALETRINDHVRGLLA